MAARMLSQSIIISNAFKLNETMMRLMSSNAAPQNIGFIGLGNMGAHMTRNLAKKVK